MLSLRAFLRRNAAPFVLASFAIATATSVIAAPTHAAVVAKPNRQAFGWDATGIYDGGLSAYGQLARQVASGRLDIALAEAQARAAGAARAKAAPPFTGPHDGTTLPGGQADMSVAVDATGQSVVIVFNDGAGFARSPISVTGYAYSGDAGASFTDGGSLPVAQRGTFGGRAYPQVFGAPDIKYVPGGAGCQFVAVSVLVVGINGTGSPPNIAYSGTAQTLGVHRSTDCGHTWTGPYEISAATNPTGVIIGGNARDVADRPSLDVDPDTGRVMVGWSNFTSNTVIGGGAEVRTALSDTVMTATPPTWSAGAVLNGGASDFDTGAIPRFAGNGSSNAYVAWARTSNDPAHSTTYAHVGCENTMFSRSLDNGVTWSAPVKLHTVGACVGGDYWPMDEVPGNDRVNSFPSIAVDTTAGSTSGFIYVVYAGVSSFFDGDILFQRSVDGGVSFSPPITINSFSFDRAQWFPNVTVTSTGRVYVIWYDQQFDWHTGDLTETMMTYSDDGGVTPWTRPAPLSPRPFHAGYGNDASQPNLGEHLGAATNGDALYTAWAAAPPLVSFADGEPASASFTVPSLVFKRTNSAPAALNLQTVQAVLDSASQVSLILPLSNMATNPNVRSGPYSGVHGTLTTSTPGVTVINAEAAYGTIPPGAFGENATPFVVSTGALSPGTKIDFVLNVTTTEGNTAIPFTLDTGTRHFASLFAETFDQTSPGSLPAGWTSEHVAGMNFVPWTVAVAQPSCEATTRGLFHPNANDAADPSRYERALSPPISIPAGAQSVRLSMDVCYNLEDDPEFTYRAYDGFTVKIADVTPGRIVRSVHPEAFAERIVGRDPFVNLRNHYPKHLPRSSNPAYMQDTAVWSGPSYGLRTVFMDLPGMAGSTVQLSFDFTQDESNDCTALRNGPCGVFIDEVTLDSTTYDAPTAPISISFDALPFAPTQAPGAEYTYIFDIWGSARDGLVTAPSNFYWAKNVVFTSALPEGTDLQQVLTGDEWTCTAPPVGSGGTVSCSMPRMAPGYITSIGLRVKVRAGTPTGTICSATATVTTDSPQDTSDDTAGTPPCVVVAEADLAASMQAPASATAGANATYRIGISDKGPSDAQSPSLSFATPPGTTFVSTNQVQGPVFACTSPAPGGTGTVTCTAAALGTSQGASFDVVVRIADTVTKIASVTVTGATLDLVPSNNTATGTTAIPAALLDLAIAGAGTGTVTSAPKGVTCTQSCTTSFAAGTLVALNAAANPGSTFTGWSGACTGTGACVVGMTAVRSVTATFGTGGPTFELTIARSGSGVGGTVASTPSGIACGVSCAASYAAGDVVTLTAAGDDQAVFIGWTGPCSGSGACVVTMNAATTVGADFSLVPSLLERIDVDANARADLVFRADATHDTYLMRMDGKLAVDATRLDVTGDWAIVHTGDFNGDGRTDFVWRNDTTGETAMWLMNGTTYSSGSVLLSDPAWRVTLVGDFDGDGKSDLVWHNDVTGETAIWLMNGAAMKAGAIVMTDPHWRAAYAADFDGDGKTDLVWRNDTTGETAIWIMSGLTFASGGVILADPAWSVTATGDFDGNGKADLVWRNVTTGETAIWLMDGASYVSGAVVLVNHAWAVTHAADLDGDGRSDLVWHNGATGETALWLMNGTVRGATARLTDTEDYDMLRAADLNGDGKVDLVWRNRVNGETKLWLMNGLTALDLQTVPIAPVDWTLQ